MTRTEVTDAQVSAAQAGDGDAMWEIVQAFDPMMKSIIRSAAPRAFADDMEDLLQEARAVLIQHVRDYDSSGDSAALTSFVYRAVRRTVQETHISMTTTLAVDPTTAIRVKRALWEAQGDIGKALESINSGAREDHRMSRERFMGTLEALASTDSLDAPAGGEDGDGSGLTLSDVIADPSATLTDSIERRDYARWLMTQIPARQAFALRAFYGVNMTAMPDAEAASDLGIKPVALRQLRKNGAVSARKVADRQAWFPTQSARASLAEAA
ncbi:hypothetical protein [Streptomyces sp. NPDC058272]|uniref:hypothetical protein n=1 Tax=Streptomyces sp. NPDC058272 TaxID=3346415 RepID=UPI0036EE7F25